MILTIWTGVKNYRHSRSPLILTLHQDGIFCFVCLFGTFLSGRFYIDTEDIQPSDISCKYRGASCRACTSLQGAALIIINSAPFNATVVHDVENGCFIILFSSVPIDDAASTKRESERTDKQSSDQFRLKEVKTPD